MELINLGKNPISEDAPGGKDARYEPDFEALTQETAKIGSLSVGSAVDWEKVVSLSSSILEKECKHLQVTTYLSYGLIKTSQMEGFYTSILVLKEMLENFWTVMFPPPKRMKGRKSIIEWWIDKLDTFVENIESVTWEKEKRDVLINNMTAIDDFLGDKMDDAPLLRPLINKIKNTIIEKKEEKPPPEPETAPEEETSPTPANKPRPSVQASAQPRADSHKIEDDKDKDARSILNQALNLIGRAAAGLRKENAADPLCYRLNRIAAWIPIDDLPTATGGKTMIPPPDEQIVNSIKTMYDAANWTDLADTCESQIKRYLFWLDLSCYSAQSMEQQGHSDVCHAIEAETSLFIQRLQGIEKLSFSDGTPFADDATLEWLRDLAAKSSKKDSKDNTAKTDTLKQDILQQTGNAQKLIKKKKIDAALLLFMQPAAAALSERERFLWKLGLCRVLINAKQIQIAMSYIDDILQTIDTYKLDVWEPENAIDALSLALTGLRLQQNKKHEELIESVIKKISMLDPIKALEVI